MTEDQDKSNENKDQFLYPTGSYHGQFTPQNLAFNANLQEFAQRVGYLCGLESNGKVATEVAYLQIKQLWLQLEQSKEQLLDRPLPPEIEPPEA